MLSEKDVLKARLSRLTINDHGRLIKISCEQLVNRSVGDERAFINKRQARSVSLVGESLNKESLVVHLKIVKASEVEENDDICGVKSCNLYYKTINILLTFNVDDLSLRSYLIGLA